MSCCHIRDRCRRPRTSERRLGGIRYVFRNLFFSSTFSPLRTKNTHVQLPSNIDSVLSAPQILGVPLLLLANKQDSSQSLSVEEIRHDYEDWYQRKLESARRNSRYGEGDNEITARRQRIASLDVMGVSALEG